MKQVRRTEAVYDRREVPIFVGILLCLGVLAMLQVYAMKDYDNFAVKLPTVAGKTYVFRAEDGGRSMALTLVRDGTFYYAAEQGNAVDTGRGEWTLVGNYVRLREADATVNSLSIWDGYLKYSEDKSTGFPTIEILNGDRFYETETDGS